MPHNTQHRDGSPLSNTRAPTRSPPHASGRALSLRSAPVAAALTKHTQSSYSRRAAAATATVDTRDRPGLLYDLTRTLTACHVRISSAIIVTYGEQAVDTFYVKDAFGLKITSKAKQEQIDKRLRFAIRSGAERAEG